MNLLFIYNFNLSCRLPWNTTSYRVVYSAAFRNYKQQDRKGRSKGDSCKHSTFLVRLPITKTKRIIKYPTGFVAFPSFHLLLKFTKFHLNSRSTNLTVLLTNISNDTHTHTYTHTHMFCVAERIQFLQHKSYGFCFFMVKHSRPMILLVVIYAVAVDVVYSVARSSSKIKLIKET